MIYVLLAFLNFKFGTIEHEYTTKRLGDISDFISSVIGNFFTILIIGQIVLYFINKLYKTAKNKSMLILNTIWGYIAMTLGFMPLTIIPFVIFFIAGGFILVICYIGLYISQISELKNQ